MLRQTELALSQSTDTIYSVSEFTAQVKQVLETAIPATWVRGQVSNVRRQSSGHIYFTLKDESSQLSAVLFRGNAGQQARFLQDGKQVIVFGELNLYEPRGNYQLITRWVLEDGIGRLQAEFERLKQQLANEGIFDKEKKRLLPSHPKTVGVITSPTGAAIRDFISILKRRHWPGRVIVFPALVQGEGAANDMVRRLKQAYTLNKELDLIVIGRGGGSLEDLWAFNEEPLVRAVAASPVPIVSAVGHEIDFTLCDFAADIRAETPSAAAELISSQTLKNSEALSQLSQRMKYTTLSQLEQMHTNLKSLKKQINIHSPQKRIEFLNLRLDDLTRTFNNHIKHNMSFKCSLLQSLYARFLSAHPRRTLKEMQRHLSGLEKRLEGVHVDTVLRRGFTLTRDDEGNILTSCQQVLPGQKLRNQFIDGEITVEVY